MNVSRIFTTFGFVASAAIFANPTNMPCDYFKSQSVEASGTLSHDPTDKVGSCFLNVRRLIKDEEIGLRQMQVVLYVTSGAGRLGKVVVDEFIFAGITPDRKLDMSQSAVSLSPGLAGTVQYVPGAPGQLVASIQKPDRDANKNEVMTTENIEITTNRVFTAVHSIRVRDSLTGADFTCTFIKQ